MHKKSSINSLFYLLFIGMITKIISMSSRIILNRELGIDAVAINSLVNPIFVFLITIASFSLPTAIASLIAKSPNKSKKILISALIISGLINMLIIILILLFGAYFSENILHNKETFLSIKMLCIVVPLTSFSSIIKGYFLGKKEIIITTNSSLIEECSRLISALILIGLFTNLNNSVKSTLFILIMIIGEIIQTTFLLYSSKSIKRKNIKKIRYFFDKDNYLFQEIFSISIPLTSSRLVTSFTFMLEPIIVTNLLLSLGYSSNQITLDYGVLSSYVIPLLVFPNFFSLAISNYLLPNLASLFANKKIKQAQKLFNSTVLFIFIIGLLISLLFTFFGDTFLKLIYKTDLGSKEIKILAIPFVIYYIETPINISLHALGLSKISFKSSLIASFLRIALLITLISKYQVFAVAISILFSCYLDVLINYISIIKVFKRNNIESIS